MTNIRGVFQTKEIFVNGKKILPVNIIGQAPSSEEIALYPFLFGDLKFNWGEKAYDPYNGIAFAILMQFYPYEKTSCFIESFAKEIIKERFDKSQDVNFDIDIQEWVDEQEKILNEWKKNDSSNGFKISPEENEFLSRKNLDREYFDAMTEGHLGSYDDFIERGGDTDGISDWAGR